MTPQRSIVGQLAILLLLAGIFYADVLGATWPYVAGAGVLLIGLRALFALVRMIES
jgi:hypothetical protein